MSRFPFYPAQVLAPEPQLGQNLVEAEEARAVRSEKELRLAIQEIAASEPVHLASEFGSAQIKPKASILIATPFRISSQVTIPSTCPGLALVARGFTPLQIDGLAVAFRVEAPLVSLINISHVTPAGGTPPAVFCDLDNADLFRSVDCWCGGTTAAFRSPSGATASDGISIRGYRGSADFDLLVTNSAFVDCNMDDLVLQSGSTGNRFVGCSINDIDNNSNASNVAAGCVIDGTVSNAGTSLFQVGSGNPNVA